MFPPFAMNIHRAGVLSFLDKAEQRLIPEDVIKSGAITLSVAGTTDSPKTKLSKGSIGISEE